jgi:hypothetical protein
MDKALIEKQDIKIKFESVYPGHAWINLNGKRVGELSRLSYGRNLWAVYINDKRVIYGICDCFSFTNAKRMAKNTLLETKLALI